MVRFRSLGAWCAIFIVGCFGSDDDAGTGLTETNSNGNQIDTAPSREGDAGGAEDGTSGGGVPHPAMLEVRPTMGMRNVPLFLSPPLVEQRSLHVATS
jgi:hypothetical protein